jgi:hypothetical protein
VSGNGSARNFLPQPCPRCTGMGDGCRLRSRPSSRTAAATLSGASPGIAEEVSDVSVVLASQAHGFYMHYDPR